MKSSPLTIRRDLAILEEQGRLRRTHGGAIALEPLLYEPFRHDSTFQQEVTRCAQEKRRIAAAAASLIGDGQTIALNPGTTTTLIGRCIPRRRGITVLVNTINVAMELASRSDLKVIVTGGQLRGVWFSLVGPLAVAATSQLFVDKVFLGVNGIHHTRGLTVYDQDEAAVSRSLVQQAKQVLVVADHTKLGAVATSLVCSTDEVDVLITDNGAPPDAVSPFIKKRIRVLQV